MSFKSFFSSIAYFFKKAPVPTSDQVAQGASNVANTAVAAGGLAAAVASKNPVAVVSAAVVTAQAVAADVADVKADIDANKK